MQKMNVTITLSFLVLASLCVTTWAQQINVQVSAKPNPDITVPQPAPAKTSKIKQVNADNKSQIFFPALKDDLVNTGSATLASIKHDDYKNFSACQTKAINDGKVGTPSKQPSIIFDLDGVWTTTFTLNTKKATKGYDIQEIRTIAGWLAFRSNQKYELLVAKVASPDTFVSLGVFENIINKTGSTQITLTGKKEAIATGVIAIRFKIMVTGKPGNTETAYREIDIIGEPNKD